MTKILVHPGCTIQELTVIGAIGVDTSAAELRPSVRERTAKKVASEMPPGTAEDDWGTP